MNHDKILEKIKELNAVRAKHTRDFKQIQEKHRHHEISDKEFEKRQSNFHKNHKKIQQEIHDLEQQLNKPEKE